MLFKPYRILTVFILLVAPGLSYGYPLCEQVSASCDIRDGGNSADISVYSSDSGACNIHGYVKYLFDSESLGREQWAEATIGQSHSFEFSVSVPLEVRFCRASYRHD